MKTILFLAIAFGCAGAYGQPSPATAGKLKDLSLLKSALETLHPGLYRYNSPNAVNAYFREAAAITSHGISNESFFLLLSKLTVKLKCGHTYLNPWNQSRAAADRLFSKSFLPVLYTVINRRFIVTHDLSLQKKINRGDEIISINGVPVTAIIDSLLLVSRADGYESNPKKMANLRLMPVDIDTANYSLFDIYFPLFFPPNFTATDYNLVVRQANGGLKKIRVEASAKRDRHMSYIRQFGSLPVHEQNWSLSFPRPTVACLRIGDFVTWQWKRDYRQYLDSVFRVLQSSAAKTLVVDVRGNEGGDDDARDEVLTYIINKSFGCETPKRRLRKFLSVPDSLMPFVDTWNPDIKMPKPENEYTKTADGFYFNTATESACRPLSPKATAFQGTVYLLTDAVNSSTTFTMADMFQQAGAGKVVGEATGGSKQGLNGGQFLFLKLPNSGFEVDIPIFWAAPTKPRPNEGVQPDYSVKTTQQDISTGSDAQLKFVLQQSQRRTGIPATKK